MPTNVDLRESAESRTPTDTDHELLIATSNNTPGKPRLLAIDILKGIGILSVVVGHTVPGLPEKIVYLFHMPLFFFLSGSLFRADTLRRTATKSAKRLLVPYACFLALLFLPTLFAYTPHPTLRDAFGLAARFIYGGQSLVGFEGAFWFATCMFVTLQIANAVDRLTVFTRVVIALGMAILAYSNAKISPNLHFPLAVNVVFAALPIFYIGYLTKQGDRFRWQIFLCIPVVVGALIAVMDGVDLGWDMKRSDYGIPVISMIIAYAWYVCLSHFSRFLARTPVVSTLLASIGRMSLGIMFVHQIVQITLRDFIGLSNDWFRLIITIAASFAISLSLNCFGVPRVLFLGEKFDR